MSRKKLIITAIILALVLAIGGILAYFTDVETKQNKFKTGKVDIEVTEPGWPVNPDGTPKTVDIVPGQEVAKDPIITNNGDGIVYAFAEVTIPKMNVKLVGADSAAVTELFKLLKITNTTTGTTAEGTNDGWVKLDSKTEQIAATGTEPAKVKYVYAYATKSGDVVTLTELAATQSTAKPVFDKVKFVDVDEDSNTPANDSVQDKNFEVVVTGLGIQKDGLPDGATAVQVYELAKGN